MLCLLFSCKKDSNSSQPPPPVVDSFLLHPPPVTDSLPIPLTIGTWWEYQRIDSMGDYSSISLWKLQQPDSSIEQITVIGKNSIVESVTNKTDYRTRYDTIGTYLLELKNLTKGTLDTLNAFYYLKYFYFIPKNSDFFDISIKVPFIEGKSGGFQPILIMGDSIKVISNTSFNVFNKIYDGCYYTEDFLFNGGGGGALINHNVTTYLKPKVGFVYWSVVHEFHSHYGYGSKNWGYRRLIDYHIAP